MPRAPKQAQELGEWRRAAPLAGTTPVRWIPLRRQFVNLDLVCDSQIDVAPRDVAVIPLMTGTDEDRYYLISVRHYLSITPDAEVASWEDTAVSRNRHGGGGRELVLHNQSQLLATVHCTSASRQVRCLNDPTERRILLHQRPNWRG